MHPLGHHLLLDLWGVGPVLDDPEGLRELLEASAREGGATVVESRFHQFSPQGVSGVVILAESHLALHTWPENDFAAVDVFTCGDPRLTRSVADEVVARLCPSHHRVRQFERGTVGDAAAEGPVVHGQGLLSETPVLAPSAKSV